MEQTTLDSRTLVYKTPEANLEPAFQKQLNSKHAGSLALVHAPMLLWLFGGAVAFGLARGLNGTLPSALCCALAGLLLLGTLLTRTAIGGKHVQMLALLEATAVIVWTFLVVLLVREADAQDGTRLLLPALAVTLSMVHVTLTARLQFRWIIPAVGVALVAVLVAVLVAEMSWQDCVLLLLHAAVAAAAGCLATRYIERNTRLSFLNKVRLDRHCEVDSG